MNRDFSVILVGVGNIGRALIENFCFEQYGFHMLAAYDVRPELVGTDISGIRVHDISELPHIFDNNKVDMAVLSVPKIMANKAAHEPVSYTHLGVYKRQPEYREILLLREINGLSYDEISRALNLEEGTVKSRIFRARKKLSEFLIREGNIPGSIASNERKGGADA